jgi:hypothetical protein
MASVDIKDAKTTASHRGVEMHSMLSKQGVSRDHRGDTKIESEDILVCS